MIANLRRFKKAQIGKEYPPKHESQNFQEFIDELKDEMRKRFPQGVMPRQAHPKMHGLLQGKFIIEKDLPKHLKVGVFENEMEYPVWVRYSSSSSNPQPDSKGDIRGMALKLVGVPGKKLLTDKQDAVTQDFVLVSCETFISRNVDQFARTIKAIASGSKLTMLFYALNPANWGVIARSLKRFIKPHSLLDIPFFSSVPYQFGDTHQAVKYSCIPNHPQGGSVPSNPDDEYLKYKLVSDLNERDYTFDFCVQFQENAYRMPIENPTVLWASKKVKLATLVIPKQEFDTDSRKAYGEILSFNPWHSLPEHRPLGGFNRARRWVYEAMAEFRNTFNGNAIVEPTDMTIPENIEQNNS